MPKRLEVIASRDANSESDRLLKLRQSLGWSQKRLADEFLVSPGTIALWELGRREIPGPAIKLIEIYHSELSRREVTYE